MLKINGRKNILINSSHISNCVTCHFYLTQIFIQSLSEKSSLLLIVKIRNEFFFLLKDQFKLTSLRFLSFDLLRPYNILSMLEYDRQILLFLLKSNKFYLIKIKFNLLIFFLNLIFKFYTSEISALLFTKICSI